MGCIFGQGVWTLSWRQDSILKVVQSFKMTKVGFGKYSWECCAFSICYSMDHQGWPSSAFWMCPIHSHGLGCRNWPSKGDEQGSLGKAVEVAAFSSWSLWALRAYEEKLTCSVLDTSYTLSHSIFSAALWDRIFRKQAWLQKLNLQSNCSSQLVWCLASIRDPGSFSHVPMSSTCPTFCKVAAPAPVIKFALWSAGRMEGKGRTGSLPFRTWLERAYIISIQVLLTRT